MHRTILESNFKSQIKLSIFIMLWVIGIILGTISAKILFSYIPPQYVNRVSLIITNVEIDNNQIIPIKTLAYIWKNNIYETDSGNSITKIKTTAVKDDGNSGVIELLIYSKEPLNREKILEESLQKLKNYIQTQQSFSVIQIYQNKHFENNELVTPSIVVIKLSMGVILGWIFSSIYIIFRQKNL